LARLLDRRDLDVVRREKGRLRSYLLVSLKHSWQTSGIARTRSSAVKANGSRVVRSIPRLSSTSILARTPRS
jgi:hypothetical protein